jgi:hypothetical protein
LLLTLVLLSTFCPAQELEATKPPFRHSRIGIGVKMSSLGAGIEVATRVTERSNLRTGFNIFTYDRPFETQGITYDGEFDLRSAQVNYDWFPFRGAFHLSPGVLIYNANRVMAHLSVPSGQVFSLDHFTFRSDPKDPIRGEATITFQKVAPAFLLGWGNLIPRKPRRFSIPFEFGFVYHGQPSLAFGLTGKGCDLKGRGCRSINADPQGQRDIDDERQRIKGDISVFRFYPIISAGFAFNF